MSNEGRYLPNDPDLRAPERRTRWRRLRRLQDLVEPAMVGLSIVWIVLVVWDLAAGPLPAPLEAATWLIWALFIVDFAVELAVAPDRFAYLRTHVLTAISLLLPALRVLRLVRGLGFLRGTRAVRSLGLARVVGSINRGLRALARTAQRRGAGYVAAATVLVVFVGAAGMAAFESPFSVAAGGTEDPGLRDYGDAIWWTASTMTTGAPSAPVTAEGRILGWALSVYGLGVFGYLTAVLATHFVGQDRADGAGVTGG